MQKCCFWGAFCYKLFVYFFFFCIILRDESKHKPPGEIGRKPISPQPDAADTWKHLTDLATGEIGGKKSSSSNRSSGEYEDYRPAPPASSSSKLYNPHYDHHPDANNGSHYIPPSKLYSDTNPPERTRYRENVHMGDEKLYDEPMSNNL